MRIHGLAPDSFATAFGSNLTSALVVDSNMPTTLDGVTLTIVDANGASLLARLYIVSPTQINYLIPADVAPAYILWAEGTEDEMCYSSLATIPA